MKILPPRSAALACLLALGGVVLPRQEVLAQLALGGQVTWNRDAGEDGTFGLGARALLSIPLTGLAVQGTADLYSLDCLDGGGGDCTLKDLGVNVLWSLPVPLLLNPYLGAGVAVQTWEAGAGQSDRRGVNILAGVNLEGLVFERFRPFGEAKYQVFQDADDQLVFALGFLVTLF